MNNLKKYNYIKYKNIKDKNIKNNLFVFLHLDYVKDFFLQLFFSRCRENNIKIIRFKLNFLKKIFSKSDVTKLLNGPTLILYLEDNDFSTILKLEKEFNFLMILSFLSKNEFIKKYYVLSVLNTIETISKKVFIPSKHLPLFFFKRLNSLLLIVLMKSSYNIYNILKLNANIKSNF